MAFGSLMNEVDRRCLPYECDIGWAEVRAWIESIGQFFLKDKNVPIILIRNE